MGGVKTPNRDNPQIYRTYDPSGIAPCINTIEGGHREPHTIEVIDTAYQGQDGHVRVYENISPTLSARDYKEPRAVVVDIAADENKDGSNEIEVIANTRPSKVADRTRVLNGGGVSQCLRGTDRKDPVKVAIPVLTPDRVSKHQNGRRFKEDGEESFTLTSQDRHGVAVEVNGDKQEKHPGINVQLSEDLTVYAIWYPKKQCYIAIRKLTPKECFRLQGWDDEYFARAEFVNSDSQLYKQAGNGVTVTVIHEMAKRFNKE